MACEIDKTVKLIDELIESKEWIKYNKTSGLPEDNKKLKEAIAKLKSFQSLKMQSQSKKTGSKDTNNKQGFNGYVSIKDTGGKGSIEGDAKDKAMREIADGFVGEIEDGRINNSSTGTSYKELKDNYSGNVKGGSITYYGASNPTIVMLARNGSLKGKELEEDTKDVIREYFENGAAFVVGDMPDVDSQFVDYLDEIGASYKIYHTGNTPRIKKQESKIEYQKESKYPTYNLNSIKFGDIDIEETRKFNKLMKIRKDIESGLKELYPEVKVDYLHDITDDSGLSVLGRAVGKVIELNASNLGIDTIPHEYAHIYINVLSGTDTISNILKSIKIKRNVTNEEAKEILARKIGELYVDDEIKLSNKDIYLIEKVWKFIVETFKKLVGGEKYKKELEEINGIKIVYQDFKTGKYKKDFADRLDSYVFASNMKNSTDKKDKELENVEQEKDIEQAVYLMSPELSKYGTLKDYKKYVSEIFPESKIDYIVAHDTGSIGSMFSSGKDAKNLPFTDSWLYSDDVNITGKGENYGLVSGEGFYTYKPNKIGEKWDQYSQFTGYIKLDIRNPLDSKSKEYIDLPGKTYYEKMSNLTNTELQSNPDEWYMLDNPPEKVTINSIVNEKTGYDGFINEVRRGLFEHVAWKNEQVHILGSKKDIEGFKQYAIDNSLKSGGLSLSDNNTVLLPVAKPEIINEIKDEMRGFKTKEEFHITLIGFPQGKYLSKEIEKMKYKDFATHNINKALLEIDTSYKLKNEFYQVERDREAFIDYRNPDLGKTTIHEKSLIQLVDAPGLIEGIKKINKDFNINLPIPFPHITLATKGGLGIGIPNKEEFDKLTKSKIDPSSGSENEVQAYKQFSKDDIEAAKDIMAKNKKECE